MTSEADGSTHGETFEEVFRREHEAMVRLAYLLLHSQSLATAACVIIAGAGVALTRLGDSDKVIEVAADGGPDSSIPFDRPGPPRCNDSDAPVEPDADPVEAIVWLEVGLGQGSLSRIEAELAASPAVVGHRYVGPAETYQEFVDYFADKPEVIDLVEAEQLPTSFRVETSDLGALGWLKELPGVDDLESAELICDRGDSDDSGGG